jgi:TRAP transporter 4TM/12TM fusion protein
MKIKALTDLARTIRSNLKASKMIRQGNIFSIIISVTAIIMSIILLYNAGTMPFTALTQRGIHLSFILFIGFLINPIKNSMPWKLSSIILSILGVVAGVYVILISPQLLYKIGNANFTDLVIGGMSIILILELTRRIHGLILPLMSLLFLVYTHFGYLFSGGLLQHRGISFQRIISHMYLTTEGIFGTALGVSATYIFMFIIFGEFLKKSGVGEMFIDFSYSIAGSMRGGPAKVAVMASALFGSISGSSVANTVTTGSLTIPLMKKVGYKPYFAGAVEAAASTGGQIMPPVMGAQAFLMAEMTGIPYVYVISAAIFPALLYFLTVWLMVDKEAMILGLKGISKTELPNLWVVLKKGLHLFSPIVLLIYLLAVLRYSPMKAAFWAIIACIIVSWFRKETRMGLNEIINALRDGALNIVSIGAACACAGLIVGSITVSGLGMKFSTLLVQLGQNNILLTLFMAMIGCVILGMGVIAPAVYLIVAVMVAPALVKMGLGLLPVHLFLVYFASMAPITPPVGLAGYAAAGIAGSKPMQTLLNATKIGIIGFVVPYMFIYAQELLLYGEPLLVIKSIITSIIGVFCLASSLQGYFFFKSNLFERFLLGFCGFLLIYPELITDILGILICTVILFIQFMVYNRTKVAK